MAAVKDGLISLWIDTATPTLSVVLTKGTQTLTTVQHTGKNDHSQTLMPVIETTLTQHGFSPKHLLDITVGVGPGSYTGTRIGVVVAKTLAHALNIPLYTVSSLAFLASGHTGRVLAAIDARRGAVFAGLYDGDASTLHSVIEDAYTTLEDFKQPYTLIYESVPNVMRLKALRVREDDLYGVTPRYLRITQAESEHDR